MSPGDDPDEASLELTQVRHVDSVCARFEAAWKAAGPAAARPGLEDYLTDGPTPERLFLLRELIRLDIHYRRCAGETPQLAEYQARFPDLKPVWLDRTLATPGPQSSPRPHPPPASGGGPGRGVASDGSPTSLETPASGAASPPPPSRAAVPGYEVLRLLGYGAMGVVYEARHARLNRLVALKMILAGDHAAPDQLARFRTEAEAVARLQHANIVQIYEVGEHEGRPYFSLEFVDGGSLAKKLHGTALPAREAARLVETLARAMHYAHAQGIIHRDLKPTNVMLSAAGAPKIMDFGLAKRLGEDSEQTATGAVLGTPSYMAPEQASGQVREIGPWTDVYGLGAILYEALAGRPPFKAATALETLEQVRFQDPVPPGRLQPKLPRDLGTICLKCLAKAPRQRYASAAELADDLGRFLAGEPIRARRAGTLEQAVKWARRRPAVAALLFVSGLAALALIVAGVALLFNRQLQTARAAEAAQRQRAETGLYFNRILLAEHEWSANNVARAEQLLDECPASIPRGWEWHYLKRVCHTELRTFRGHEGQVEKAAFSPDGRVVASVGEDKIVRLWEAATGQLIRALTGHSERIFDVAFSRDGKRMATVSGAWHKPGEVILWDAATGALLRHLPAQTGNTASVAFSPDGQLLAAASGERDGAGAVQLWDAATGRELRPPIRGLKNEGILSLKFSPDGKHLAAAIGTWDIYDLEKKPGEVRVWDARSGEELFRLHGHTGPNAAVAFSPDGARLASAGWDQTVRIWDLSTRKEVLMLRGHRHAVGDVMFSPDGSRLASASQDGSAKVWDAATGRELFTLRGHAGPFASVAFSPPDGARLVTAGDDGMVKLWDATSNREALTLSGHAAWVTSVAFSPDNLYVATGSVDRTVKVWDASDGHLLLTLPDHGDPVWSVAFSPDGRYIASASGNWTQSDRPGGLYIWDAKSGARVHTLSGHPGIVWCVAYSPDGRYLASSSGELLSGPGEVRVWEAATGAQALVLRRPSQGIPAIAFRPDSTTLAAIVENMIQIWEVPSGREVATCQGPSEPSSARPGLTSVSCDRAGERICAGCQDNTLRIWDLATGAQVGELRGHSHYVRAVAYSPDGRRIASASVDQTVKLWDAATGQELLTLRGHTGVVWGVAFSPDGRRLASASQDRTVKIWDATPLAD